MIKSVEKTARLSIAEKHGSSEDKGYNSNAIHYLLPVNR